MVVWCEVSVRRSDDTFVRVLVGHVLSLRVLCFVFFEVACKIFLCV